MAALADVVRNHVDYSIWATARLLNTGTALTQAELTHDFGTADKSIAGTLTHIYRSERSWLERIQSTNPPTPSKLDEDEDWTVLTNAWPKLHDRWREWARGMDERDLDEIIHYTDLKGNTWAQPLWPIVLHVVNHGTHHRGQVSGFLRALGKTPPPLDFIAFVRQQAQGSK